MRSISIRRNEAAQERDVNKENKPVKKAEKYDENFQGRKKKTKADSR